MNPPHFYIFVIISPLKRIFKLPFIWTNLNSLYPSIILPGLIEIGPVVMEKIFFFNFSVFLLFPYYLPLEKGVSLQLIRVESPSPKSDLCQVWLKLTQWFWRRGRRYKSLQTDRRTGGRRTTGDRNSSLERKLQWAKICNSDLLQTLLKHQWIKTKTFLESMKNMVEGPFQILKFVQNQLNVLVLYFIGSPWPKI
jgi:hypothetical protein